MNLPRRKRIAYGVAEVGVSGAEVMLRVSLLIYYTQVVGIRPDLASYAIALGVFWDAVTDPLMGGVSDRCQLWGQRRRPFFLPGALGLSICLIMVFNVPQLNLQWQKFLYLLLTYLGTNTFLTLLSVPHTAFAGDLSQDAQIRRELFAWRLIFANLGLILGTAIPAIIVALNPTTQAPDAVASWIIGGLIIVSTCVTFFSTSHYDQAVVTTKQQHRGLAFYRQELLAVLSFKPFAWLLLAYMIATIGLTLNSSLALYYYQFFLQLDEVTVRGIIAFFMMIFCLAIPLWIVVAQKTSPFRLLIINVSLLGLMTIFGYPFFPAKEVSWPLIAGLFGGIFVGAVVLMDVAVADLADRQSSRDGSPQSQQGLFFGFWKMGGKLSRAIALIITGHALTAIGFDPQTIPSPEISSRLALLFGPGVGVFLITAAFLIHWGQKKGNL